MRATIERALASIIGFLVRRVVDHKLVPDAGQLKKIQSYKIRTTFNINGAMYTVRDVQVELDGTRILYFKNFALVLHHGYVHFVRIKRRRNGELWKAVKIHSLK